MYVAMNHFRVAAGRGGEFEARWSERRSYLDTVAGFVQFHLVRGKDEEDGTLSYASHVIWDNRQTFLDWTHSEAFRLAHAARDTPAGLILEHPRFQGWEAVEL
jgi:heme-degrading monooxygenase HmoA